MDVAARVLNAVATVCVACLLMYATGLVLAVAGVPFLGLSGATVVYLLLLAVFVPLLSGYIFVRYLAPRSSWHAVAAAPALLATLNGVISPNSRFPVSEGLGYCAIVALTSAIGVWAARRRQRAI